MQLALKRTPPANAPLHYRMAAQLIKVRLCSQYEHGAIVIGGTLYQATAQHGLHSLDASEWSPDKWVLIDVAPNVGEGVLRRFYECRGAPYDWRGIANFAVPIFGHSTNGFYCFSWVQYALTGERHNGLITPESLLAIALVARENHASS